MIPWGAVASGIESIKLVSRASAPYIAQRDGVEAAVASPSGCPNSATHGLGMNG